MAAAIAELCGSFSSCILQGVKILRHAVCHFAGKRLASAISMHKCSTRMSVYFLVPSLRPRLMASDVRFSRVFDHYGFLLLGFSMFRHFKNQPSASDTSFLNACTDEQMRSLGSRLAELECMDQ